MTGSTTTPAITRTSLPAQAAEWLRDGIVSGRLEQGSRLVETAIAEEMGLSRSTARAGLLQLAAEGLVVQHAHSGWSVVELSSKDAWEVYTLRSCLDALTARLAAERLDDDGKAAVRRAFDHLVEATKSGDAREVASADVGFHTEIAVQVGHERLLAQYALIRGASLLYIAATNRRVTPEVIRTEHQRILNAILAGDAEEAERYARQHVMDYGKNLVQSLSAKNGEIRQD